MSDDTLDPNDPELRGPIAWMARNSVASNLIMFGLLIGGVLLGLLRVKQEVFPAFDLDLINVAVPYPGASPAEVEQGIILAVEEEVRGIDGVKRVTSVASEGAGTVSVELLLSADPDRVLADVKSAVDRIRSFPQYAEKPQVSLATRRQTVISLVLSGDQELAGLHALAEEARLRLLANPDVTQVEIEGVPELEVSVEIPRATLEAHGLTPDLVAAQIKAHSLELPGGTVKTDSGDLLVRVADRRRTGDELGDIVLRGTEGGGGLRLRDIATIRDGYADTDLIARYNGERAVRLVAYRVGDETPQRVSDAVKAVAEELRQEFPPSVNVSVWHDDSEMLAARIDLLMRNARMGLVLVFIVLALFLDLRLSTWVALGIPVSVMGAMMFLPIFDASINMVSLFGFILTLGIVVDDAIVVSENIYDLEQAGMPRMKAAIIGARQMVVPVSFSVLTTIVAFAPLLAIPGFMGKIFGILPIVVISVLSVSWFESFFILPSHLAHDVSYVTRVFPPLGWLVAVTDLIRRPVGRALDWASEHVERPAIEQAMRFRYMVIGAAFGLFVIAAAAIPSGLVPFSFFPKLEGDLVTAEVRMPFGTPVERTLEVQQQLEAAADRAIEATGGPEMVRGRYATLGRGPQGRGGAQEAGGHLLTIELQLVGSDERAYSSKQVADAWAAQTPLLVGPETLKFNSSTGPGAGAAVDVQLSHPDTLVLAEASELLAENLRDYPQLVDIENDYASGKPQFDYHLTDAATTLGVTSDVVARQIRSAFYGAEALREQRGRNELKVMVRLPEGERRSEGDLEDLRIRTPSGAFVPLQYVATFDRGRAATSIRREDGRRIIDVKAELSAGTPSSAPVLEALAADVFPKLRERWPNLEVSLAGEQREQGEVVASLRTNFLLALLAIYALLAVPFRSYVQPLIIMSAIPMGFVGAVGGHFLMGYEFSIISMMGLIALSGVVVNDCIVLIDAANTRRTAGATATEAMIFAGTRRLRPILLTSLTTFFGLFPMILETSVQARFLIPMALSLGFGVLFTTFVTLLLVPCLYMVVEDTSEATSRLFRWLYSEAPPSTGREPGPTEESAVGSD